MDLQHIWKGTHKLFLPYVLLSTNKKKFPFSWGGKPGKIISKRKRAFQIAVGLLVAAAVVDRCIPEK